MNFGENRVDPSGLSSAELDQLQTILDFAEQNKHPFLKGLDGAEYRLPESVFEILIHIIYGMRHGKTLLIVPEDETFTTQAAANYLGMSRQYFVGLLEAGIIPHHRVGSHRRVYFKDLRDYAKTRDKRRRSELSGLFKELQEKDLYDSELKEDAQ